MRSRTSAVAQASHYLESTSSYQKYLPLFGHHLMSSLRESRMCSVIARLGFVAMLCLINAQSASCDVHGDSDDVAGPWSQTGVDSQTLTLSTVLATSWWFLQTSDSSDDKSAIQYADCTSMIILDGEEARGIRAHLRLAVSTDYLWIAVIGIDTQGTLWSRLPELSGKLIAFDRNSNSLSIRPIWSWSMRRWREVSEANNKVVHDLDGYDFHDVRLACSWISDALRKKQLHTKAESIKVSGAGITGRFGVMSTSQSPKPNVAIEFDPLAFKSSLNLGSDEGGQSRLPLEWIIFPDGLRITTQGRSDASVLHADITSLSILTGSIEIASNQAHKDHV